MMPYGRHVLVFSSPDFVHWSPETALAFAREGAFNRPDNYLASAPHGSNESPLANEQTHEGASVWNRGNILIGLTGLWHGSKDWTQTTHPLGFIISNDGLHFREPLPNYEFAPVGRRGFDRPHFVEDNPVAGLRGLPSRFRTSQAGSDDLDSCTRNFQDTRAECG